MKILIVGPSWVGDMVMSQSLYITLKTQHPHAKIDVLAPAWCKPILERMPEVNKAIEMPVGHGEFAFQTRRRLGLQLRNSRYNHAYILPNSAKSALIPFFAKIPKRTGWKGEMRYGLLNDLRANKNAFQYMVERYVALAHPKKEMINSQSLGGMQNLPYPSLSVDEPTQKACFTKLGLTDKKPIIGLCPGAEFGPAKQWPIRHYASVASEMVKQGYQVWLFGSIKDENTTSSIKGNVKKSYQDSIHDLAGKTSLTEVIDLLAACKTVVSNDSGLMHVAAAVSCNIVAVYGSTSPEYTPPLARNIDIVHSNIECRPCFKRECQFSHLKCLTELLPSKVIESLNVMHAIKVSKC